MRTIVAVATVPSALLLPPPPALSPHPHPGEVAAVLMVLVALL